MSRRTLINLVFFSIVFFGFLWWAVNNIVTIDAIENPYEIAGEFEAAAGILPDAEVSYLGVRYGRVDSVELLDEGVRIEMKIQNDKQIPEGSTANIFRKSAVGEPYILFVPPDGYEDGGPHIEEGDVLPMSQTSVPLEFSEMLRSASRLVSAIDAGAAGDLIHELAVGLANREEALRQLTLAGDTLSESFAERTDALDRLATNNTRLTRVVSEHRGSLGQSLDDLRALSATLRDAEGDLLAILEEGSELAGRTAEVVAHQKGNIDCILSDLEAVLEVATTDIRIEGLRTLLDVGPDAFAGVWDTRDVEPDGVWVRVGLIVNPVNPAEQYVPAKEIPEVRAVPPCGSGLIATTGDFTPSAPEPQRQIPATGRDVMLSALLLLLTAGVVLRMSLRHAHR